MLCIAPNKGFIKDHCVPRFPQAGDFKWNWGSSIFRRCCRQFGPSSHIASYGGMTRSAAGSGASSIQSDIERIRFKNHQQEKFERLYCGVALRSGSTQLVNDVTCDQQAALPQTVRSTNAVWSHLCRSPLQVESPFTWYTPRNPEEK